MDIFLTDHLAEDVVTAQGLGERSENTLTGRGASRVGMMEMPAIMSSGANTVGIEMYARDEHENAREAQRLVELGKPVTIDAIDGPSGRTEEVQALFHSLGWDWDEDTGKTSGLALDQLRENYPTKAEVRDDGMGTAAWLREADGVRIVLPRTVVNPILAELGADLLGMDRARFAKIAGLKPSFTNRKGGRRITSRSHARCR